VNRGKEVKSGEMTDADIEAVGAGDQGMMFGYACNETPVLMPLPIYLAHKLTANSPKSARTYTALAAPDGKAQVTVEYHYGRPKRVDTVLVSTQHAPEVSQEEIRRAIIEHVIMPVLPADMVIRT